MKKALFTIAALFLTLGLQAQYSVRFEIPFPKPLRQNPDTVSVMVIGDVMMHSKQLPYDYHTFLADIAPEMRGADFCVANMEFPLGGKPYMGYPVFSAPDEYPGLLCSQCGIDVMLTANNHMLDKGDEGLSRTLGIYDSIRDSLGVGFTGSARDAAELEATYPVVLSRKGIRIALINFTYGTNIGSSSQWPKVNRMRKDEIAAAFGRAREQKADFIVALPHWGEEYQLKHSAGQQEWAEWLVSEGADVIVGSHPHVVQDTAHVRGVPVIYSVGNAISNMSAINTRLELAVILRFVSNPATGEKMMLEPELHFLWCTLPGNLTDSYATVSIEKWASRKSDWLTESDYSNMVETLRRVTETTGIEY